MFADHNSINMKKLIICLSVATALSLPAIAAEKTDKPAEKKACCAAKGKSCSEKKEACRGKSACHEKSTKSSANIKGAEALKQ